jgi:hypothetical protein
MLQKFFSGTLYAISTLCCTLYYGITFPHSTHIIHSFKKVDLPGLVLVVVGGAEVAVEAIAVQLFSTHFLDMSLS